MDTAIMTDSNSGITSQEAEQLGIYLAHMPFIVNGTVYHEDVDLSRQRFFQLLEEGAQVSTSQVEPGHLLSAWEKLLETYQEVGYIPMSSGLSGSCVTAAALADSLGGRVQVADNHRISVTQRQSVYDALSLAREGRSAREIKDFLERDAYQASIYITVDTLEYLKKGGRLSSGEAMVGTVLQIKPILHIAGEKLVPFRKVRGMKSARHAMLDAIQADMDGPFRELYQRGEMQLMVAYSHVSDQLRQEWIDEVAQTFPGHSIVAAPLSLSVSCHIGPGALAVVLCHFRTPSSTEQ